MQKEFQLAVDIEKKILTPSFEVNTLDLKTIKLKITITKGMSLVDLTDITVRMSIRKPDGNVLFQDCQVVNAKGGQVEIILENQAYVMPGSYSAEIMCFKGTDKVAVTGSFSYRSIKGIMDDKAVESKSEFTAITKQLENVQATVNDLRENGTGIDAQARQEVEQVSALLVDNANKLFYQKIYLKEQGLRGDNTFRSISSVFPSVTLAQVQALNPSATLSNSADWYVIQKLIKESTNYTTIVVDGRYIVDLPILIDRSYLTIEGKFLVRAKSFNSASDSVIRMSADNTSLIILQHAVQVRDVTFRGVTLLGKLEDATGKKSLHGVDVKSSAMNIIFDDCYFALFGGNGVHHTDGHLIHTKFNNSLFYRCALNGVFMKHINTAQVNIINFFNTSAMECGLKYVAGKGFVRDDGFTELSGAGFNLSGTGIEVNGGESSLCPVGVIINRGYVNGFKVQSVYFEADLKHDIYVYHASTGETKNNVVLNGNMYELNNPNSVVFENETDRKYFDYSYGLKDVVDNKPYKSEIVLNRGRVIKGTFQYNQGKEMYTLDKDISQKSVVRLTTYNFNAIKASFDYEYIGGTNYNVYAALELKKGESPIESTISNKSEFGNAYLIASYNTASNSTTIHFNEDIVALDGYTQLILARDYGNIDYTLNEGVVLHGAQSHRLTPTDILEVNNRSIKINRVINLGTGTWRAMFHKKNDTTTSNLLNITGCYSSKGKCEMYFCKDSIDAPFVPYNKKLNADISLSLQRLDDGQKLMISNVIFEEVTLPRLKRSKVSTSAKNIGLRIWDVDLKKTIQWDGTNWIEVEGGAIVV